jgi:molecular chaperone IbpA
MVDNNFDRLFNTTRFNHSLIGFDKLLDRLASAERVFDSRVNYPPYNLEQIDEDNFRITLAVAGFTANDIDITLNNSKLTVKGSTNHESKEYESKAYIHRGLASRNFERSFLLADHVIITGANMENGLLTLDLKYEMPEALKPRKIEINQPTAKVKASTETI